MLKEQQIGKPFDWPKGSCHVDIVDGAEDGYMRYLQSHHRQSVATVVLRWDPGRRSTSWTSWTSLADTSNVIIQTYYNWAGDDVMCSRVTAPSIYDAMYNRTCETSVDKTATSVTSLRPVSFRTRSSLAGVYLPNNFTLLPLDFYAQPPSYVMYLHVHRNAIVTENGDVIGDNGRVKLVLSTCGHDITRAVPRGSFFGFFPLPTYEEVFVATQYWGAAVFHRMVEVIPRIVPYIEFLQRHPDIMVSVPMDSSNILSEVLQIMGLSKYRLVTGATRARIVYQPRSTSCGMANVQEIQMTSQIFRDHIRRSFATSGFSRNRLLLLRRSRLRRFREQELIESLLKSVAAEFNLEFSVFLDEPVPSLNDTMMLFHTAVVVVGPHGAGLSNIVFCQPGTFVVEGVCDPPHVNLCYQHLAYVLGHRWYGLGSRDGACEKTIDVSAERIESAVRRLLNLRLQM